MEIQSHVAGTRRLSILTNALAVLITFVLLLGYQVISGRQQLLDELRTEATIIGANSTAALLFNDAKAAQETLAAIRFSPRIIGGALYRVDGQRLAFENDPDKVFPRVLPEVGGDRPDALRSRLGLFARLLREEVYQDGMRVGTLLIHATYRPLYWRLFEFAISVILIGAIALALASRFTANVRKKMALTEDRLRQMALYDPVTGLPNRSSFEFELAKAVKRIKREGSTGALLFIDVDDFKKVNDLCGHQAGDQVLLQMAQRLKLTIRASDIVARVGGDEFAAILYSCGSPQNAAKIADQLIAAITEPFPTDPIPSHVGLSIGVTMIPHDSDDPETLLRWADMAMYVAKSTGKNRYQFFSEDINDRVRRESLLEAALRQALKAPDSGLSVAYQPQLAAGTRAIVGVEALMRWQLDGEAISPADFIRIAEKSALIVDIGVWLIRRICQDLAEMKKAGVELAKVAVNVSPRELTRASGMVEGICRTLAQFGEKPARFEFEVTETALMDRKGAEVLDAFRAAGFALAIDDFGSGYSSLGYLKRFHVSTLKIDQQFIQRLPGSSENAAIVCAVIQMAKALGVAVVAEGVESEEQAAFLSANGCDVVQGYLFSRPLPPRELVAFVTHHQRAGRPHGARPAR